MKKIIGLFLALLLITSPAFAARSSVSTIISSTLLDNSPTSVSGTFKTLSSDKLAFFVTYDETEVGNSISLNVTVDISWDGTTWLDASFYDYAGGTTLQTSETISGDGNYYFWFNRDLPAPYVRVVLAATNTDADDTALVSAKIVTQEV